MNYLGRWIWRSGMAGWPACSLDLTLLYSCGVVYVGYRPTYVVHTHLYILYIHPLPVGQQLHLPNLTFIGLCIVIYSYRTTNKMHLFLKLFVLVKHSTCFRRSFCPSSGAQDCTYSCCYLLLEQQVAAAVWHMPVAVCTVMSSWWWTERPSETCRVFYKNKCVMRVIYTSKGMSKKFGVRVIIH
jgi:hypothetical protein